MIEIMVALILLGITGISLLRAFSNASRNPDVPENSAYYLASQVFAQLNEAVRQDNWNTVGQPLGTVGPGPQPLAEILNGRTYTPAYTVNGVDLDGGGDDFRQATVTVSW